MAHTKYCWAGGNDSHFQQWRKFLAGPARLGSLWFCYLEGSPLPIPSQLLVYLFWRSSYSKATYGSISCGLWGKCLFWGIGTTFTSHSRLVQIQNPGDSKCWRISSFPGKLKIFETIFPPNLVAFKCFSFFWSTFLYECPQPNTCLDKINVSSFYLTILFIQKHI